MQTIQEMYGDFVIRDQEETTVQPLDLLQGWRSLRRERLRIRLGRALVAIGRQLARGQSDARSGVTSSSMCGLR